MTNFKKTFIAVATLSTLAVSMAAPANAGWKSNLGKGLAIGAGVGIAAAILAPRRNTVVYAQPTYVQPTTCRQVAVYNTYGQFVGHQTVC